MAIEVDFYDLGLDACLDAILMRELHSPEHVDVAVFREFDSTVKAYQESSIEELVTRVGRYDRRCRTVFSPIGILVMDASGPIGFSLSELKTYEGIDQAQSGVNISAWVSKTRRGIGIGSMLMQRTVEAVRDFEPWKNEVVWTGIADDNGASIAMCENVGFKKIFSMVFDGDARSLYVLDGPQRTT